MSDRFDVILGAVDAGKSITIRLYIVSEESEKEIQFILKNVLEKYSEKDLIYSIYTIVKEMAINAAKANMKRAIFKELNLDLTDGIDYKKGLLSLKEKLSEKYLSENSAKLRELKLYVDISFNYDSHALQIEVLNQAPLTKEEDVRIRRKFSMAKKYDNIVDFYLEEMDNAEGSGIGIVMILMLLKENGIGHKNFIIESDNEKYTRARLNFPFK